jgi:hypothetical protein
MVLFIFLKLKSVNNLYTLVTFKVKNVGFILQYQIIENRFILLLATKQTILCLYVKSMNDEYAVLK